MFGIDSQIASLGSGQAFLIVAAVAILLGLRHATDPDHLTAVSTLIAGEGHLGVRSAGRLGLAWGLGHATALLVFGLPIVLFRGYLPEPVQQAAEVAVGLVIMALALRLLVRWRRGHFYAHARQDACGEHRHLHTHNAAAESEHDHDHEIYVVRSPRQAFGIGLIHGTGGSAGVGVLLLAAIPNHLEGVTALVLFASCTAVSMALASTTFGYAITRGPLLRRFANVAPLLGTLSLAFGTWYTLGAMHVAPYAL
jgi:ABC-type nickel/cobalt efflux system permease component RcnA